MKRKILALVLTLAMVICVTSPVMAASEDAQMSAAIAAVKEQYPNAVVRVTEAGTLAVFVPSTGISPSSANSDRIYAPTGGSYTGFLPPIGYLGYDFPICRTFLPGDLAQLFYVGRSDEDLFDQIMDAISTASNYSEAVDAVARITGFTSSAVSIAAFAACQTFDAIRWLDLYILESAMENGTDNAIYITRISTSGVMTDMFFGWSGTYVDASPYEDWNPTWYPEDYTLLEVPF